LQCKYGSYHFETTSIKAGHQKGPTSCAPLFHDPQRLMDLSRHPSLIDSSSGAPDHHRVPRDVNRLGLPRGFSSDITMFCRCPFWGLLWGSHMTTHPSPVYTCCIHDYPSCIIHPSASHPYLSITWCNILGHSAFTLHQSSSSSSTLRTTPWSASLPRECNGGDGQHKGFSPLEGRDRGGHLPQ